MTVSDTERISALVVKAAPRVARLGSWPEYISPVESLASRIPTEGQGPSSGFDAGIACCLDLIPRDKQRLAAQLHAAYTPEAIAQVLREAEELNPDDETCWWLAACSVCEEGAVDSDKFADQLKRFGQLMADPDLRVQVAAAELAAMRSRYQTREDGTAFGEDDGCMQGAYVDGHAFAGMRDPNSGLFFLGTFHASLGLEDFPFSDRRDDQGRPMSGGVHGSRQFVKCADQDEYEAALLKVKEHFKHQGREE